MKKLIITAIILFTTQIQAQEKSRNELKGDKYIFNYSYDEAIGSYTKVKQLSTSGQRNLAVSYHKMNLDVKAELAYAKLLSNTSGILPVDYFNYAMVLKINGNQIESNKWMDKFVEFMPDDLRAKSYNANYKEYSNLAMNDGRYKIIHLDMNTDAEDFGASYFKNKIVFASSRATPKWIKRKYNWNNQPFLDTYVSEVEQGQLKGSQKFNKYLDGKLHDGPASFSLNGTYMAFTRNDYDTKRKDKIVELQICFSNYKDGKWSKAEPFVLNNKGYSVGHPYLTADGKTMYFTSNMPGGYGGADIYRISKNDKGIWVSPENMGNKINTEGDEMFPFFEEKSGVLSFASNGHFGLGGLDIFVCTINSSKVGTVRNAGYPLNTASDDFALIVDSTFTKGYFSSNRTGGSGDDDIYAVDLLKGLNLGKCIKGIAKNKEGKAIPNTFITLLTDKNRILDTLTTKEDGAYAFLVDSDKDFKLVGKKEKYLDGENHTNSFGTQLIIIADVILLTKEEVVKEKIVVGADLGKILDLKPSVFPDAEIIYFDLDKFNLRPDAVTELAEIVKIMNQYPDLKVELRAYTDCRETVAYNQILSEKRAKVSAWYIKARITNPERIFGKGYGETNLANGCACEDAVKSTCTDEEHQKNRRTEFIIVKK